MNHCAPTHTHIPNPDDAKSHFSNIHIYYLGERHQCALHRIAFCMKLACRLAWRINAHWSTLSKYQKTMRHTYLQWWQSNKKITLYMYLFIRKY